MKSESKQIIMSVNDPKGRELAKEFGQKKMTAKFDAESQGQHQICVQNKEDQDVAVEVSIQTGDFSENFMQSQKIMKKHLRPVEMQAFKVNEMVTQLRSELSALVASEVKLSDQNDSIKSRVFVFGIISILVMAISTFLQVKYLKNFFRHKKII